MVQELTRKDSQTGLLPTPPRPDDLGGIELTDNARQVLVRRYVRRGKDGKPAESVEDMFWRVAYHVAAVESTWQGEVMARARQFYALLTGKAFFPNSPTFTGAGTPLGQLAACFVLPISDDMGRDSAGIFQTLRDAALIQQTGGGNGFSFSRLRPHGSIVKSSAGQATGPVGFLRVYDKAFGEVAQGGCLLPDTLVFTDQGLLRLDEIADPGQPGWQPHTLQVATDDGWRTSPRAYNNGVAPVLRVHTRQGLSLAGTPDHRLKVMTEQGPAWRKLRELAAGDWIIVQLGQQRGKLQALRHPQPQHGNQTWPALPAVLDEELAFFLGYLSGDGFVASREDDHRVGVSVAHSSYLYLEMPALLERLFGVTVHHQQKPDDRSTTFVIDYRALKEFLVLNGLGKSRSRSARVPRLIRQSPPAVVGAYLRGLFEADGTLSHGYPTLLTTSPRLAEEAAALLVGLGCPVHIRSIAPGVTHYGSLPVYNVRIESTLGLQAWREKIGCDRRSRFEVCYAWESDLRRESSYVIPYARYWLQPVLDAITLEQVDERGRGIKFRSQQPRLRRHLLRYLRQERSFTRSAFDQLGEAYPEFAAHVRSPEGLWFVQVQAVEQAGQALTLDLEVDQNHTYLAYGMLTHNTRRGANMAVLRVDHPDIEEFITCKTDENAITNFNISVGITDAFMRAVQEDGPWDLRFPDVHDPRYSGFNGTLEQAEAAGVPIKVHRTLRARELLDKIVNQAHHNGEPGMLFLDAANRSNPVPHLYALEATNPCHRGSNLVHTTLGILPIKDLVGREFGVVTPTGEISEAVAFQTGVQPLYRVSLDNGLSIDLTENHNLIVEGGKKRQVKDLKFGDRILLSANPIAPMDPRYNFTEDQGMLLGWNAGDGWITFHTNEKVKSWQVGFVFGRQDEQIARWVEGQVADRIGANSPALKERFDRGVWELASTNHGFAEYFLEELGAVLKSNGVPVTVKQGNRAFQRGYLRGLFSSDGYVSIKGNGKKERRQLGLVTAHERLARDVQILLSTFGILSRLRYSESTLPGRDKRYSRWQLTVNADQFVRFIREIGFMPGSAKQEIAEDMLKRQWRDTHSDSYGTVTNVEPLNITEPVYNINVNHELHQYSVEGLVSANCGEQWLGPHENCCLGSVNLAQHLGPDGRVDWEKLRQSVELSTIFLDDVVEANAYVPAVPQLAEAAHRARRIGLGIMGLGDLMYHAGIRYGSEEGQEFGAQVMEFVRYHAMRTSVELARQRGAFPAISGSIYDPDDLQWAPPAPITPFSRDYARPPVDWDALVHDLRQYGIRNAAQTTVAPTGTIATVAGCEGYGCEPVFALAYIRHVNDNGRDLQLAYASPLFEAALVGAGLDESARQAIVDHAMQLGSCQDLDELPEDIRHTFVVSQDIRAEEHVRMQAALQAFVDNSLSKTINFPEGAGEADVATAYQLAWELGCKGITVYVTGSRQKVVLETHATAQEKEAPVEAAAPAARPEQMPIWHENKKPRPRSLKGYTYNINTPLGKAFVTINENGGNQPFEAFINTAKAGSDTAAVSEAIGRLISYIMRLASPIAPRERLKEVVRQLSGIGGGRSLGFGPNRVRSLPDGVAQILDEYIQETEGVHSGQEPGEPPAAASNNGFHPEPALDQQPLLHFGDLCPECGQAAVVNEEGCRKCYACGFSEC
jgi:ribonucleotide reductase alpha subunit